MDTSATIPVAGVVLAADVVVPEHPRGVVIFAHGSGSSRHSPRNRYVAEQLQDAGLATILADLLTREEELADARTAALRFDIGLLAERVAGVTDWIERFEPVAGLRIGSFGASTGAAAALVAAAERPQSIKTIVSRGGRPDLAGESLPAVHQPTLLIVGERDTPVIELNIEAMRRLGCDAELEIVPGATHLFEEPGALERVAVLARDWFVRFLPEPV